LVRAQALIGSVDGQEKNLRRPFSGYVENPNRSIEERMMKTRYDFQKGSPLHRLLSLGSLLAIVLALLVPGLASAADNPTAAPYIIVFKDSVDPAAEAPGLARAYGLQPGFVYQHALKGMSALVPAGRLVALQHDPRVAYVVEDRERHITAQSLPTGIRRIFADENAKLDIDGSDDWRVDVDVAVIDTGIDFQHPDLNVAGGVNCTLSIFNAYCAAGGDDDHYHGTHVAGTIGALDNDIGMVGVAPGARLWAVKVLNKRGSGWSSWIIAGIDWVAENADTIEVANMSLGGSGFSQAEYDAIQGAVNKGVAFAVAAGNEDDDARNYSPGGFDNVLSVSALADFNGEPYGGAAPTCRTDVDDTLADFSNWGPEVDVAAPGVCILSTYPLEKGEYGTISGTSMASPHVAGALALLASRDNPNDAEDVAGLYGAITGAGNKNWDDDSGDGTQESLLDVHDGSVFDPVLVAGSRGGGGNTAPSLTIDSPVDGASFPSGSSISFAGSASDAEDGDLTASLAWTSSLDGSIGSGGSFSAALSEGTHTITASSTDSGGLCTEASISIAVEPSSGGGISLSVQTYKVRAQKYADLTWSGATSANVDVYRDESKVATTPNDGAYSDGPLGKDIRSATYQVCEAGTSTCSSVVEVTW
jgi:subtilisin family serine protease